MTADDSARHNRPWSSKWQSNDVTTFTGALRGGYDGEIREFWESQLVGSINHVVDIGCGNGAVTWICDELLNGNDLRARITGIDEADIEPFKALGRASHAHPNVRFIANTSAESLPFENNSVDLVVSQFGIEYSDFERSIPEVGRVLTERGRIALILHNRESILVRQASLSVKDIREMLDHVKLDELALELVQFFRRHGVGERVTNLQEYKRISAKIEPKAKAFWPKAKMHADDSAMLMFIRALNQATNVRVSISCDERERIIREAHDRLIRIAARENALSTAALTPKRTKRLVELAEDQGLRVLRKGNLQYAQEENFGTIFVAAR